MARAAYDHARHGVFELRRGVSDLFHRVARHDSEWPFAGSTNQEVWVSPQETFHSSVSQRLPAQL